MQIDQIRLRQIILEEIKKIREGVSDLDLGGVRANTVSVTPFFDNNDEQTKTGKTGMSKSEVEKYAKSWLKSKNKDPDVLKGNSEWRLFKGRTKTFWVGEKTSEIKREIRTWLKRNILNDKKPQTPQPKKKPKEK